MFDTAAKKQQTNIEVKPDVALDGRMSIQASRARLEVDSGTKMVLCQHPTGYHTVLAEPPERRPSQSCFLQTGLARKTQFC
jgi:hypothetical protein